MADWKPLAVAVGVAATLAAGWQVWNRVRVPSDPGRLFRKRCSTCHRLPELARFDASQIAGLVRTMREKNGADKVISDAEALVIIAYLEEKLRK